MPRSRSGAPDGSECIWHRAAIHTRWAMRISRARSNTSLAGLVSARSRLHLRARVLRARQPRAQVGAAFGGVFIANEKFAYETAEQALESGEADAVAFGKLFIANPDLPKRFALGAPLNEPRASEFYVGGANGYTDYPRLAGTAIGVGLERGPCARKDAGFFRRIGALQLEAPPHLGRGMAG